MLLKRLPDGSKRKRWLPGWVESLMILAALLCSVWGSALQRGRADPEMAQLAHDSLQSFAVLVWGITIPHWDALSQYTFYGPWIESFQDSWWDPEFPQLSQMVQSLPGFLNLSLNVCSPCQVLGDVYTEVRRCLHRGKRCLHRGRNKG